MIKVYKNISQIITLEGVHHKDGRCLTPEDLGIIEDGSIVISQDQIEWVGKNQDLPIEFKDLDYRDCSQYICLPEFVDSHTHLVFAGNRSHEYIMRLNGADYEQIAQMGGGIQESTRQTNAASFDELFQLAQKRIESMFENGVGTIEIKSGYGLGYNEEKRLSEIIFKLKQYFAPKIQIFNTFMAAHAIPPGKSADQYIDETVLPLLEECHSMIDIVDIFHEKGYFEKHHVEKLFQKASKLKLQTKSHADEFWDNNGASLAVKYKALSCDHLLQVSQKGIKDLANSSTIATLLPGTAFFLGKPLAPARELLDAGCKVALASDFNPGSCHWDNLVQIAKMSAPSLKMNIAEVCASITYNASHALGLKNQGAILHGFSSRIRFYPYQSLNDFFYTW